VIERDGVLYVNPGVVEVKPGGIIKVRSALPVECSLEGPAIVCELITAAGEKLQARVAVVLREEPAASWPAWLFSVLALAAAAFAFLQWRRGSRMLARNAVILETAGEDMSVLQRRIQGVSQFLTGSPARRTTQSGPSTPPARVSSRPPSDLQRRIDRFLEAVEAWRATSNLWPQEVENNFRRVMELRNVSGADGQKDALRRFQEPAITLARVALNQSDEYVDPEFQNSALQNALQDLLTAAELKLIQPRHGERFRPELHDLRDKDPSPSLQYRGLISRVVRRGLEQNRATLSKAFTTDRCRMNRHAFSLSFGGAAALGGFVPQSVVPPSSRNRP
jgi:hypothetical protein